jgi:hypothetical protein
VFISAYTYTTPLPPSHISTDVIWRGGIWKGGREKRGKPENQRKKGKRVKEIGT